MNLIFNFFQGIKQYTASSFFKSCFDLIGSQFSLALSGIIFWWVAARFYSVSDLGYGAMLISLVSLISFIASLGMNPTIVRFLPHEDTRTLLGTFLTFSFLLLVVLYIIAVLSFGFLFDDSSHNVRFFVTFFILVSAIHFFQALDSVYLALKTTGILFFKNVFQNFIRIIILIPFVSAGGVGIVIANASAALIALIVSVIYFLIRKQVSTISMGFDYGMLKKMFPYSMVNFMNAVPLKIPGMVFPLIIVYFISKQEAGLFYIPWMIFSVTCGFIVSITNVFLHEASQTHANKTLFKKMVLFSAAICVASMAGVFLFATPLLALFKDEFARESVVLLKLLFISLPFFSANQIYISVLNVRKNVRHVFVITALMAFSMVFILIFSLSSAGSSGIAWAWLVANVLVTIYIACRLFIPSKKES